tara:strand:+ start:5436 stop:6017 length:582 start_codon:yes stop_codon:yes gene_type:complete
MKYYDEDGEVVEAFSKEEFDTKLKEASTESATKLKTAEDSLKEKAAEYDKLNDLHEAKKTSYTELQNKTKDDGKKYQEVLDRDKTAYDESVDAKIKTIAGDDKEYAAELKKQLEAGVGVQTIDAAEIEKQVAKAAALTNIELEREVSSPSGGGGGAPISPDGSPVNFTETTEGIDTVDAFSDMMGLPAEEAAK